MDTVPDLAGALLQLRPHTDINTPTARVRSLPTLACLKRVGSQPSSPVSLELTHHRLPAASGQPPDSIQGNSLARRPALSGLQHGAVRPLLATDGALERAIERVLDHHSPQTNDQTLNSLWPSSQDEPASALARQFTPQASTSSGRERATSIRHTAVRTAPEHHDPRRPVECRPRLTTCASSPAGSRRTR